MHRHSMDEIQNQFDSDTLDLRLADRTKGIIQSYL